MIDWAVPWTNDDTIDFIFLAVTTLIVVAVPLVYGSRANLRDPLARAVVAGTGATAVVFGVTVAFTLALHVGWSPDPSLQHWIARAIYSTVGFGKLVLLIALVRAIREKKRERGFQKLHDGTSE